MTAPNSVKEQLDLIDDYDAADNLADFIEQLKAGVGDVPLNEVKVYWYTGGECSSSIELYHDRPETEAETKNRLDSEARRNADSRDRELRELRRLKCKYPDAA